MSDLDLDELRCRTRRLRPAGEEGRTLRRARSASSPASKKFSASSRSTARLRSTGRIATSSNGSMPCASTAFARLRNADRCLSRSTIRGCWPTRRAAAAPDRDRWTRTSCLPNWRAPRAQPTSPNFVMSAPAPKARGRRNRQPPEMRGLRSLQAALSSRFKRRFETASAAGASLRAEGEIRPGNWFIVGGQKAYVAEMGEAFTNAQGRTDARLRVIFDNGTESNMLMRSLQRALHKDEAGRRITDPVAGPLFSDEHARGRSGSGHNLCPAEQVRPSGRRGQPRSDPQDRRHECERRAAHRRCAASTDIPHGRCRSRRDLRAIQHQPH